MFYNTMEHPGHPEKEDVKTGDQHRGGIEHGQFFGLLRIAIHEIL